MFFVVLFCNCCIRQKILTTVDVITCIEEHNSAPFVSFLDGDTVIFCEFIQGMLFVVVDVTGLSRIVIDKKIVALFSGCIDKRVHMYITTRLGSQIV